MATVKKRKYRADRSKYSSRWKKLAQDMADIMGLKLDAPASLQHGPNGMQDSEDITDILHRYPDYQSIRSLYAHYKHALIGDYGIVEFAADTYMSLCRQVTSKLRTEVSCFRTWLERHEHTKPMLVAKNPFYNTSLEKAAIMAGMLKMSSGSVAQNLEDILDDKDD